MGALPTVGLGGKVGLDITVGVFVGGGVLSLGLQLARAAPAAIVAVTFRNVRRVRFARRFMFIPEYMIMGITMVMRWAYIPIHHTSFIQFFVNSYF
jgi:hypothetical protein